MQLRKIGICLATVFTFLLAGCFDTTEQVELKEDGSGTFRTTNDMSSLIELVKAQITEKEKEEMGKEAMDTTMSLASQADSVKGLDAAEKELLKKGELKIRMDLNKDEFIATLSFPFATPAEINTCRKLSQKVLMQSIMEKMNESPVGDPFEDAPPASSFADYYTSEYTNHLLVRTLDKEKFAKADSDKYLATLKESASMGAPMSNTYVFDLPRPATKAEGKGVVLSEDKKKVTIKVDINDFFDDPSKLEYRIEF